MKPSVPTSEAPIDAAVLSTKVFCCGAVRRVVVVGRALEAVGVHGDCRLAPAVTWNAPSRPSSTDVKPPLTSPVMPPGGTNVGMRLVLDVHDAADRLAAVAQRRRAAHDLDAIGGERIDRDGVILRQRRDVVRADAVLLHAHAVAVEAADDRAVGAGGERRAGDAGLRLQRVGEGLARRWPRSRVRSRPLPATNASSATMLPGSGQQRSNGRRCRVRAFARWRRPAGGDFVIFFLAGFATGLAVVTVTAGSSTVPLAPVGADCGFNPHARMR